MKTMQLWKFSMQYAAMEAEYTKDPHNVKGMEYEKALASLRVSSQEQMANEDKKRRDCLLD